MTAHADVSMHIHMACCIQMYTLEPFQWPVVSKHSGPPPLSPPVLPRCPSNPAPASIGGRFFFSTRESRSHTTVRDRLLTRTTALFCTNLAQPISAFSSRTAPASRVSLFPPCPEALLLVPVGGVEGEAPAPQPLNVVPSPPRVPTVMLQPSSLPL